MSDLKIKNSITFTCSGCDGKATFTPDGERPTFMHTFPFCERFNEVCTVEELTAYMRECAEKQWRS